MEPARWVLNPRSRLADPFPVRRDRWLGWELEDCGGGERRRANAAPRRGASRRLVVRLQVQYEVISWMRPGRRPRLPIRRDCAVLRLWPAVRVRQQREP